MTNNIVGISEAFSSLEEQSFLFLEMISNINIDSFGRLFLPNFISHGEKVRKLSRIVSLSWIGGPAQKMAIFSNGP